MTDHHDPISTHAFASEKHPQSFNWSLDQELSERLSAQSPHEKIRYWLNTHEITTINYFLTHFSAARLSDAIDDYERATSRNSQGNNFKPYNPTRFFRSLLTSPEEKKIDSQRSVNYQDGKRNDPDKYIKGKYGHMVRRDTK